MIHAEDKARELVDKIKTNLWDKRHIRITLEDAMVLAHLTVDEILNDNPNIYDSDRLNHKYWKTVKEHIDEL